MKRFASKDELRIAYEISAELDGHSNDTARLIARTAMKYIPHIYRGGYVIPHFGYSTERIGRYISRENAGVPENVR